jgi:hypothetical protein
LTTKAIIGQPAPLLAVSKWVQGDTVAINELTGRVILVEVFQVNCPGCFLYALPQAIQLHQHFYSQGLSVAGIATAFEDFDKNTVENLQRLADTGEVIGETQKALQHHGLLENGRLPYQIPFPLAMDNLVKRANPVTEEEISAFITEHLPDYFRQTKTYQDKVWHQVSDYLSKLSYHAQTFETYQLKGTPSTILIDKKGILRECAFGQDLDLEAKISQLLQE